MIAFNPNTLPILLNSHFWITIAVIIISPLSLSKRLDALKFTSAIALLSVVYLVGVVVGYAVFPFNMPPKLSLHEIVWFKVDGTFLTTLPIFVFAFTCHQNVNFKFICFIVYSLSIHCILFIYIYI